MNNFQYNPDPTSLIQAPFNITFLSQRDAQVRIPINYVTSVGVSVTAACFSKNRFEDYATVKCISNLLTTGFRRLDVDLYWDAGRRIWSFCPVSLPRHEDESSGRTMIPGSSSSTSMAYNASITTSASTTSTSEIARDITVRQAESLVGTSVTLIDSVPETPTPVTTATVLYTTSGTAHMVVLPTAIPSENQELLFSVGPYTCSGTNAVDILTQLLPSFLTNTDNTLQAVMQIVIMNIHAASSIVAPLAPAPAPETTDLPGLGDLLGQYFETNSSSFLYTPALLAQDRSNLNATWLSAASSLTPIEQYFNVTSGPSDTLMTPDGWPSSSITEFQGDNHRRLLFGYGRIDPQMAAYDYAADNATVFYPGYLSSPASVDFSVSGLISSGCFYDSSSTALSLANTSWSFSTIPSNVLVPNDPSFYLTNTTIASLSNLTSCGISPFLNSTLLNTTADIDITPYKHFAYSSVWSWAWNQPITSSDLSCAVLDPSLGRWLVADCNSRYRAACRIADQPFAWQIGTDVDVYTEVRCPTNSTFDVPRTALENRYLHEALLRANAAAASQEPLWINLNSRSIQDCWVPGVNATCPYDNRASNAAQIYVPTVAGVIILVITVLLIIVKCGANRAHSKRKRKGENGWDYEGVPS